MKFFVLALIIIGIFALALTGILSNHVLSTWQLKIMGAPTEQTPTPPPSTAITSATGTGFFPTGFRGPTSAPHVVGPSGPPPNY